jgi:hypothetical protein
MKRTFFSLLLASIGFAATASTPSNTLPFDADEPARLEREMADLQQLETIVSARNATYSQLAAEANPLLAAVSPNYTAGAALLGSAAPDERLLGIPGFFWGCCFGTLGVILVYVAVDDPAAKKREGRQAMVGCAIATIFSLCIYLIALSANVE